MTYRNAFEECLADNDLYTEHRQGSLLTQKELQSNFDALQKCFGAEFRSPKLGLRHIDKGIYADQLDRWLQNFHLKQFHIVLYEDFSASPLRVYEDIIKFIGHNITGPTGFQSLRDVEQFIHKRYGTLNNTKKKELPGAMRTEIECFYKPYNIQLAQILKRDDIFNASTVICAN